MTVTINGTNGITTPEITLDNATADGGQVVLKSSGYSDWNWDNYSGRLRAYYGATEYFTVNSSGNVGIGTSSPSYKLEIANTSNTDTLVVKSTTTDVTPYLSFDVKGSGGGQYIRGRIRGAAPSNTAGGLVFETGDSGSTSERMRIDSSGNLLVGTTSSASLSGPAIKLIGGSDTGGSNYTFYCTFGNNGNTFGLRNDGYMISTAVYGGTTATAANVAVTSDGLVRRSTSALKYKQDIRDLESIDVNKFRPVRYKSKCEGDDQTVDHFGIIADEVDASGIKELVTYGVDGEAEGFQYERLTVVLIKAIQELSAKVDAQAAEIAALKGQA